MDEQKEEEIGAAPRIEGARWVFRDTHGQTTQTLSFCAVITASMNGPYGYYPSTGAAAPTMPGVDQRITILNDTGGRIQGMWRAGTEVTHFTIENGHTFNLVRTGGLPITYIGFSTPHFTWSESNVLPIMTVSLRVDASGTCSLSAPSCAIPQGPSGGGVVGI